MVGEVSVVVEVSAVSALTHVVVCAHGKVR